MLETIGTLIKEEQLKTVDSHILPNSFVLQNLEPFPGYHGKNLPVDRTPDTFFLITHEEYPTNHIFRISHDIRQFTEFNFKASTGKICIGNDTYPFIRLRGLNSYNPVEEIQQHFMDAGIKYQKQKNIDATGLIELQKIFMLESVSEHVFFSPEDKMYYLLINRQLPWGRFKKLTLWVKNNLDDINFDGALAVVYARDVYDLVRIYSHHNEIEKLEKIRGKYLEAIKRTE